MKAEIYGRQTCTYCNAAKDFLNVHGIKFEYYDIEKDPDQKAKMFERAPVGIKTVPQIFLDGEYVGGYSDLREKLNNEVLGVPI